LKQQLCIEDPLSEEIMKTFTISHILRFVAPVSFLGTAQSSTLRRIPYHVPPHASDIVPKEFQSFSIELSYWPDFTGNLSHPNKFSANLLRNLEANAGHAPVVRIGRGTQYVVL
jgi:hypothetical protein